jgi:hypothetical protein
LAALRGPARELRACSHFVASGDAHRLFPVIPALVNDFGRIAKPLRKPAGRLAQALRRLVGANALASNWAARAKRLKPT